MSHTCIPSTIYGKPSFREKLSLAITLLRLPSMLAWTVIHTLFRPTVKSQRRRLADAAFRYAASSVNVRQMQYLTGTTRQVYKTWARRNKLSVEMDQVGDKSLDAWLLWVGDKQADRVILYLHGGAYLAPVQEFAISFWEHIQSKLKNEYHINTAIAIVNYSLVPTAGFTTQLSQAIASIKHLLKLGIHPSNIQIVADSAGAHLALGIISHILHCHPSIPPFVLPSPLRGIYLMSPWVTLSPTPRGSMVTNAKTDIINANCIFYWGEEVFRAAGTAGSGNIPDVAFLEPIKAPYGWFDGMEKQVERVLVTAGGAECLRDDIMVVGGWIHSCYKDEATHGSSARVVIDADGVHNEVLLEHLIEGPQEDGIGRLVLEWLAAGWESKESIE